ncbi:MAG: 4a-hydroxytetrahydrobiopterin dehydratase [Patescibacteria group bacterium]|nr:4a-hydroxytetrahydrobiopterin dehydratase [Patescibacteria group bacterium]
MDLSEQKCVPCEVGGKPLDAEEAAFYSKDVPEWHVAAGGGKISRAFRFKDFKGAMAFANKVAALAEEEGHHPDMIIKYGEADIELWTHAVGGLSVNDFILAAKIDRLV